MDARWMASAASSQSYPSSCSTEMASSALAHCKRVISSGDPRCEGETYCAGPYSSLATQDARTSAPLHHHACPACQHTSNHFRVQALRLSTCTLSCMRPSPHCIFSSVRRPAAWSSGEVLVRT